MVFTLMSLSKNESIHNQSLAQKLTSRLLKSLHLLFFLSFLVLALFEYRTYTEMVDFNRKQLKESVGERLLGIARSGAAILEGDKHAEVFGPRDDTLPEFIKLRARLRDLQKAHGLTEDIYTLRLENAQEKIAQFVIMSGTTADPDKTYIGTRYVFPESMLKGFLEGKSVVTDLYQSKSVEKGFWISAFAPFKEPGNENFCVLEVDMSMDNFLQELDSHHEQQLFFHLLRWFFYLIVIPLIYWIIVRVIHGSVLDIVNYPLGIFMEFIQTIKKGVLNPDLRVSTGDELEVLADSFNEMIEEIKRQRTDLLKHQREFEFAREVQRSLLPRRLPSRKEFEVRASYSPAKYLGGDFYDIREMVGKDVFLIADVAGKGLPSALYAAAVKAHLTALLNSDLELDQAFQTVNYSLCTESQTQLFCTLFAAVWEHKSRQIKFCSAGHNHMMLIRDTKIEYLDAKEGLPLGIDDGANYSLETCHVQPGDLLFLFTDGCVEAHNEAGELNGFDGLENFILQHCNKSVEELEALLKNYLEDFSGNADQSDDITVLFIRFEEAMA